MSCTPPPSSPPDFALSSIAASTAPSSPPPSEFNNDEEKDVREESEVPVDCEFVERYTRLTRLLEKSLAYTNVLKAQMDKEKTSSALRSAMQAILPPATVTSKPKSKRAPLSRGRKRRRVEEESDGEPSALPTIAPASEENTMTEETPKFLQPELITGAKLKDYQLEGVEWMVSLDKNGVSGILADEMGLGKTLQTIAFNAHLRGIGHYRPFLIVCPLSVLHNWKEEFQKFAPDIPVCVYHGTPAERAELRRTTMREPDSNIDSEVQTKPEEEVMLKSTKRAPRKSGRPKGKLATLKKTGKRNGKSSKKSQVEEDDSEDDEDKEEEDVNISPTDAAGASLPPQTRKTFPVVVTTYEMIIKDRTHLARYNWGYIVVDEGHRLKNLDCRLMQEIKKYPSAGRMILTGTPLHNNMAELWSLLNFILPDIFDDLDTFQEWFNLGTMQSRLSSEQSSQLIHTLHGILKPFLLRRLKADVEGLLPPKKEYVLYAPLSVRQRDLYDKVVEGGLRSFLLGKKDEDATAKEEQVKAQIDVDAPMKLRKGKRRRYDVDGDDDEYFEMVEGGGVAKVKTAPKDLAELGRSHQYNTTLKQVNNMKLQNTVMQLRKVCSHPFLFDWPVDAASQMPILNEELVDASGKMMILERLLDELFRRKHKVLLFSQFTTMLDIIEDWAVELKGWSICRIDGSTAPLDRREQMNRFQEGGDKPGAPILFLLSTRAGGLGITLTAADTVIFYDQDWNPQMDVQAQDRAHRIGQTKPVLVFRLVSAHTIETKIMHRATEKRKLEALVIAKGKFKMPGQSAGRETMAEMAASLLKLEGEQIEVVSSTAEGKAGLLSDAELDMLLDRSDAVYEDRGKGWTSGGEAKRATFAVYDAPVHEDNAMIAKIMGESLPEC
ncbi:SNF2 family N-terminal domain-containing protein [Hygrophoropsis aurantiaca]|uniref:SNF2 family N-terminal domain-containing protein n=1 Tax=Hygrophoropsis aurantiaca TaxID=72124 RepID=A0ACB8AA16_9AGAM|nr:SNF2 family N-terminal domain-containing protein [Hygrophoropsis aurantiaca]